MLGLLWWIRPVNHHRLLSLWQSETSSAAIPSALPSHVHFRPLSSHISLHLSSPFSLFPFPLQQLASLKWLKITAFLVSTSVSFPVFFPLFSLAYVLLNVSSLSSAVSACPFFNMMSFPRFAWFSSSFLSSKSKDWHKGIEDNPQIIQTSAQRPWQMCRAHPSLTHY